MRMRRNSVPVPIRAQSEAPVEGHSAAGDVRRCGERGSARLKAVVWIALLGAFIFVCVKVVPVLFNEYQFQDAMQTTARFATINRQSPDEIRKTLVQEAKSKDIPVQPENIHVTNDAGNVKISADYSVTVDLQVYQLTLNLHPSATNNVL
jgi:uncharacterized protein DUF4845